MKHIDLEPQDYSVKGRKEPILHPHWKIGVIAIVCAFVLAVLSKLYIGPAAQGFFDWLDALLYSR